MSEHDPSTHTIWDPYSRVYDLMTDVPFVRLLRERHVAAMTGLPLILDAGCGSGLITADLASIDGHRVTALEINPSMLRKARQKLSAYRNVTLLYGDAGHLPFPTATFHGCVSNNVLYLVPDPELLLSEMVRVTRPGGVISIASPRSSLNVDILLDGLRSYVNSHEPMILNSSLELFIDANQKLANTAKHLYEAREISARLLANGCSSIVYEGHAYLEQNFFVIAKR